MLHGLDLFSGIGGLALALEPWVRPVAYCEIDAFCQRVLIERMRDGSLPVAPIWDDVRTLSAADLDTQGIDVICGGFPCQDVSTSQRNPRGVGGERSGLVFELLRLVAEIRPAIVFMENVPGLRRRGAADIIGRLAGLGYDARWGLLSAAAIGAPHRRRRLWIAAADATCLRRNPRGVEYAASPSHAWPTAMRDNRWPPEPDLGRVAHGLSGRVDRIRALGNAVVPAQAREAFARLTGTPNLLATTNL